MVSLIPAVAICRCSRRHFRHHDWRTHDLLVPDLGSWQDAHNGAGLLIVYKDMDRRATWLSIRQLLLVNRK